MPEPIAVTVGGASIPSRDVSSIQITRGRNDILDRHATGTANINLNIVDGRANPIAFEVVGADAVISLRNPVTSEYVQLYEGIVDDPIFDADKSQVVTRASISCVDLLDKLGRTEMAPGEWGDPAPPFGYEVPRGAIGQIFYEDSGQVQFRIEKMLEEAKISPAKREIFSGNVSLQETLYSARTPILQGIHDCCDAEFPGIGQFFVDKFGVCRFKGRLSRFNPSNPVYDVLTFNAGMSDASRARINGLTYSKPRSRLINAAYFYPKGIAEHKKPGQVVLDQGSIDQYGIHDESGEELLTEIGYLGVPNRTANAETRLFGVYYVDNYASPKQRIDTLTFRHLRADDYRAAATWDLLCNVDLTHLVDVSLSGPGWSFNEPHFVESIDYTIVPGGLQADVTLTLGLSPQSDYSSNPF